MANELAIAGDVAHDAVDSGNPAKIGGVANSSTPTAVSAGDRVNGWYGLNGQAIVSIGSGILGSDGNASAVGVNDAAGGNKLLGAATFAFNNSTNDRWRNNQEVTALSSAARTTSTNTSDLVNYNSRGAIIVIDVSAGGGAGSITAAIKGKDTVSGKYILILTSAAITTTGTTAMRIYPGLAAVANADVNAPLPRLWRVEMTAADSTSYTYTIGVNYIF